MTQEKLPSVRSLVESDIGPLRRFTGMLDSIPQEEQTWGEGTADERKSMRLSLNYKDLEVIESVEPYHFPIYSVLLGLSNRKKSKYGVFGSSLTEILDQQYSEAQTDPDSPNYIKPTDRMDLGDCIGKRIGMVMADGEDGRPAMHLLFDGRAKDEEHPRGQDVPTATWEVYMVEGVGVAGAGGVSPMDKAMELLDGKTVDEFRAAAMQDDLVKGDMTLLQSIGKPDTAADSFGNTMVTSGKFTKDEATGKFAKV